jgi:hypothetical protein
VSVPPVETTTNSPISIVVKVIFLTTAASHPFSRAGPAWTPHPDTASTSQPAPHPACLSL